MIRLAPLGRAEMADLARLSPRPEQEAFALDHAKMVAMPEAEVDFHGIRAGDEVVGYFMVDRAYHLRADFAAPGDIGLRGVLIDAAHQGQGLARAAFAALPEYLARRYPDRDVIYLTVNLRNGRARDLYARAGWVDDGELYHGGPSGPQHVMRLVLRETAGT